MTKTNNTITIPTWVNPSGSIISSSYVYTTSFGTYTLTPALNGTTYSISYRKPGMAVGSVSSLGFILLENHTGSFIQFPSVDYGTATVTYSDTGFQAIWNLTYNNVVVATVSLTVTFSRTGFPKISVDVNQLTHTIDPNCVDTLDSPCPTTTYWADNGLKDFMWQWVITPSSGYDNYQSASLGTIPLKSTVQANAVHYVTPSLDGPLLQAWFGSWFAEWQSSGLQNVHITSINPLTSTSNPSLLVRFTANTNVDPTFGVTGRVQQATQETKLSAPMTLPRLIRGNPHPSGPERVNS